MKFAGPVCRLMRGAVIFAPHLLFACDQGGHAAGPTVGPHPQLAAPGGSMIPVANFPTIKPWPSGQTPSAPAGFVVTRYASGLDHPRWIYRLPNGDILVAESATEPRAPNSLTERAQFWLERNSGAVMPSANRITLLRDSNANGVVTMRTTFLHGLHQPFGMLLAGNNIFVANTDGVWRFPYRTGETEIDDSGRKILDLPVGGYNNHWTRNLTANVDGTKLFVTVGSGSNIGEHGTANEFHRADIIAFDPDGSDAYVFASGLRNPCGMAWEPRTHALWTVVNERDMLGDDLVPDYLTRVRKGEFYGWPYSYWGRHLDPRVRPQRPDLVARAIAPDYALGAHVAALGLAFYTADAFPAHYRGGAFIGMHGSWNRSRFAGYKVVYVPFTNGMPSGPPEDFLTGFMHDPRNGTAYGRPVGVAIDRTGALLVADDAGDTIWRVAPR